MTWTLLLIISLFTIFMFIDNKGIVMIFFGIMFIILGGRTNQRWDKEIKNTKSDTHLRRLSNHKILDVGYCIEIGIILIFFGMWSLGLL